MQRRQPPAGPADPIAQRGTIQRHALTGEDLRLAIQREMISEFVYQHMRQQRLGGHAAIDWTFGRQRLHDRLLAGPAAIPRPADHLDPELGRNVVQHFDPILADRVQRAPATGTCLVFDIDHYLDPRQMRRQRAAVALRRFATAQTGFGIWRSLRWCHRRLHPGRLLGQGLFQILKPMLQSLIVQPFGAAAKPVALQAGDHQLQPFNLGQRRAQDQLQGCRIVGQRGWGGEHATDAGSSLRIDANESGVSTAITPPVQADASGAASASQSLPAASRPEPGSVKLGQCQWLATENGPSPAAC